MALTRIDEKSNVYEVKAAPSVDGLYERYSKQALLQDQGSVKNYVEETIQNLEKFSLATNFGDPWPEELSSLYKFCQDEKLAAFLLASIVIDALIQSEHNWICTKTNIQDRDFASNFYWRNV